MKNRYKKILKKEPVLYMDAKCHDSFDMIAAYVVSPVAVMYTNWILHEAQRLNIRRLYFMARDGYQMYHIANLLCRENHIDIECSYFYCSRYALRMAAYHFFDDAAYDRLFLHAYRQSACSLLQRAGFDADSRKKIFKAVKFDYNAEKNDMSRSEFDSFCLKIKNSEVFKNMLWENSYAAYSDTIEYIRQEGMQNYDKIGIVDLGWTGSLQHTLRRILDSGHIHTEIIGFYMGMLDKPPIDKKSCYLTWLFNDKKKFTKAWFAHNLTECLCTAPHGMTKGYLKSDNIVKPIFTEAENPPDYAERIKKYALQLAGQHGVKYSEDYPEIALRILKKLMFKPNCDELQALGEYHFCDDVSEQYHRSIVQKMKSSDYRAQILPFKYFVRDSSDGFYWYFGSLEASGISAKVLYKVGYIFTRYFIIKLKG